MDAIRDQRTMIGAGPHHGATDVVNGWNAWVAENGLPVRRRRGDHSTDLRDSPRIVVAYVSGGKWIADCPECNGGIACWSENPRGACLDCGTVYPVDHPEPEEAERVAGLLAARPDVRTRSWNRHLGETLDEVAAENDRYLTVEESPTGVVAVVEVERVLGKRALAKLRAEGVV